MRVLHIPPSTLRARLVLASSLATLGGVALLTAITVLLVGHQLRSSLDGALRTRAEEIAQLAVSAPALLTDPGALETPVSGRQIAIEVLDAGGRIIARSLTLGARLLPQDAAARAARVEGRTAFEDIHLAGRPFRLYAAPIAQAGGPAAGGAVLVASDTTDIAQTSAHLGFVLAVSGAAVALLAAVAAAIVTRRGLRPLRRLTVAAEEIERTGDPARRLPTRGRSGTPPAEELAQLSGVLNRMLASLERSRAGERRFLADASHELRTPVTTLLGNVEYASRHGADPEVLADLQRDAARLARLVDDLLALEREAASDQQLSEVALDDLVRQAVEDGSERLSISRLDPATVRGDAAALTRMVQNLIENALVHGPERGRVEVATSVEAHAVTLSVRDEGPGPDPGQRERIFERFWRAEEATGRPGSGLGLSIVKAIADRHGGQVTVAGATFSVRLPLVEQKPSS